MMRNRPVATGIIRSFLTTTLLFLVVFATAQNRSLPIGIFDSGTGGLTILNTITQHKDLDREQYIYLADQANMPYGNYYSENKTALLRELVLKDVQFLQSKKVKTIVIACNTATAYAFDEVQKYLAAQGTGLKVIGVINAGAKGVLNVFQPSESGSIGVFATVGTVASKGYEHTIINLKNKLGYTGNIQVHSQGGHGIAEAVDEEPDFIQRQATRPTKNYRGPSLDHATHAIDRTLMDIYQFDFSGNKMLCDSKETDECGILQINSAGNYVRYHLVSLMERIRKSENPQPLKALVLGCTHYPYLKREINQTLKDIYNYQKNGQYVYRQLMSENIKIIDPAENVAAELYDYLHSNQLVSETAKRGPNEFYITVPNTDNKKVPLDGSGRFTYSYKYGRQEGIERNDVKTVPFNENNIPSESYDRFRGTISATYRQIAAHKKYVSVSKAFPAIDSIYSRYARRFNSPGMVYGIVSNGEFLHIGKIGYSNVEKKIAASERSAFRIASMSKSFTAMAILQLRDQGKLKLDDEASMYISELKDQRLLSADAPPVTIRNLLTHSAGFPEDNPWGDRQLDISEEKMLEMFRKGISFSNNPGTTYEYSNMGFAMLGYIVKQVSGKSYQQFITENIFRPLGMHDTYWEYDSVPENQLAIGYRYVNGKWVKQPMLHDGAYGAMGGLITTMEDFKKYLAFHLSVWPASDQEENGPLKRSSVREMQKPWEMGPFNANAKRPDGRTCATVAAYGYGLRWLRNCEGRVSVGHSGGLPGFGSNWLILPDYDLGVICFSNVTYAPATMMNNHALDTLIRISGIKPRAIPASDILKQRQHELVALLPQWKNAERSGIFAENFFLDYFIDSLRKEAAAIFSDAGKIIRVQEIVAENNLRGTFIIEAERADIEIYFTLSPENPPLIQEYAIRKRLKK